MKVTDSPAELLELLRHRDPEACARCVQEHWDGLYRLALRILKDPQEAEDTVQETFLNAFRNIDTFQGRSSIGTWLFRIAYNTALMRLRKTHRETVSVEGSDSGDGEGEPLELFDFSNLPEEEVLNREVQDQIQAAIQDAPSNLRTVFALREVEGLSTAETAEVLGLSEEAVKTRLHRGRLWLRQRLSRYFAERERLAGDKPNGAR
ncbi:MAG: sigma-70 family RNA polymerase sigma factor [Anaerolineales bacterium]|jgi:RNA polymerase sigma-70 factor (ECF subfamily)